MPLPEEPSISFTSQDLILFRDASSDCNPLHLSEEYARGTPFGQPVVFGCLGALACLSHVPLPGTHRVVSMHADFPRPMFCGVPYTVKVMPKQEGFVVSLYDGSLPVVTVTLKTATGKAHLYPSPPSEAQCDRQEAAQWAPEQITQGVEISGTYAGDPVARLALAQRWKVDPFLTALLCWGSYLVGMELPGKAALFSRLILQIPDVDSSPAGPVTYRAAVHSVDARFGLMRMKVSLSSGNVCLASGECWSYIRPLLPDTDEPDTAGVPPDSLAGKAAVLIGASRGLGASLQQALEMRGASVYSLARSAPDSPRTVTGDAADPDACRRLRQRIEDEQGRLDFLICNAFPAIRPLLLEPNSVARIADYINQAVAITLTPMCEFLDLLNASDGCLVLVSSSAVEQPVKEWPHYIAAKQAVEMLARVAPLQYSRISTLIVRPQKLLTALTNTPMGRADAISPGVFGSRIAKRLEEPLAAGATEILS